ncbi:MAG: hypothetical protein GY723_18585 [bacterium]|nr:hypothetical protein [bacterium]
MTRPLRLDAPGCIHHVTMRGVDGRAVFLDDVDRESLVGRLSGILPESGATCFAWAFMTNHVHMVLKTGQRHLSKVMHRVNGGFVSHFNARHGRRGYLFQSRFTSRIAANDTDVLGLIRYVHLNPLRGGLVPSLDRLPTYPWTGHAALLGLGEPRPFHSPQQALRHFDEDPEKARARLRDWMAIDERRLDQSVGELAASIALEFGISTEALRSRNKNRNVSRARAAFAKRAHAELALRSTDIARWLRVSRSAVTQALRTEAT